MNDLIDAKKPCWEDPKWLEVIIKRNDKDKQIIKLSGIDYNVATTAGENYISIIYRVNLKGILGSGKRANRSIIVKTQTLAMEGAVNLVNESFRSESLVYMVIMKKLKEVLNGTIFASQHLWPKCYYASLDGVIMEDLKASGYRMADRKAGLDLQHALLVMTSFGRLHGLSYVAIKKGLLNKNLFRQFLFVRKTMHKFYSATIEALSITMTNSWNPKWRDVAKRVKKIAREMQEKLINLYQIEPRIKVMCHGDSWVNNHMYKYDETGTPVHLKFVDFQICHYSSYAWDLTYFMYTSLRNKVRVDHFDNLIKTYSDSFSSMLETLGENKELAPKPDEIIDELERIQLFAFTTAASILPLIVCDPKDVVSIDDLMGDPMKSIPMYSSPHYIEIMESLMEEFVAKGII